MCGIAGFAGEGSRGKLESMVSAIRHRGPDDQGIFLKDGIGLAHSRLSIIDVTVAGHQPMFNHDETVAIIFNGEIYNFPILKKELLGKGCVFKSHSDTEVILRLYEVYGEACFEKLVGMFAVAIFDFAKNKLVLARDRMGEKPLYWSLQKNTLVFASELGALMVSGLIQKEVDLASLNKYLLFDYVPTPHTILKDVYKLEPATYLVYEGGTIRKQVFWSPPQSLASADETEAMHLLDNLLEQSVSGQLVSDVPLGVFLSGGIDSSTIAWYAQKNSKEPISTFSIGFQDSDFDESKYAREVSALLGTHHYERVIVPEDALSVISQISEVFSEPVADASVIPTLLLSEFTQREVKVSLGGDGGDELFAGYPTFQAERIFGVYVRFPWIIRKVTEIIIRFLPAGNGNFDLSFNLKKFISSTSTNREHRHMEWLGSFPEEERLALTVGALHKTVQQQNVFEDTDKYKSEYTQPDPGNRLLYVYLRSYLMDEVLVKVDRASMHHSLEVRAPLLDYRVADFLFLLPHSLKNKNFQTKYFLKKLMRGRLPDHILDRKKKGFGLPMSRWLRGELKELCNELLSADEILRQGLFNPEYVIRLKSDHFEGRVDNRKQLWNLMVFSLWHKKWLS